MRNLLVVLSGPSGVGKGTIAKEIVKKDKNFALSISCTTRAPRKGEKDGREYTDATLEQVAYLLGKRDHSTVIHGVEKIKKEIETNSELRGNVEIILKKLNITP